jgi:hypothetical protein
MTETNTSIAPIEVFEKVGSDTPWFHAVLPGPIGSNVKRGSGKTIEAAVESLEEIDCPSEEWRHGLLIPPTFVDGIKQDWVEITKEVLFVESEGEFIRLA